MSQIIGRKSIWYQVKEAIDTNQSLTVQIGRVQLLSVTVPAMMKCSAVYILCINSVHVCCCKWLVQLGSFFD